MIRGDKIHDHDVVSVMKLVLITTITKNRPTFAVYFRVTSTAIKIPVTKRTNANVVFVRFVNRYWSCTQ